MFTEFILKVFNKKQATEKFPDIIKKVISSLLKVSKVIKSYSTKFKNETKIS